MPSLPLSFHIIHRHYRSLFLFILHSLSSRKVFPFLALIILSPSLFICPYSSFCGPSSSCSLSISLSLCICVFVCPSRFPFSVPYRHDFVNRRQLQDALHEFDFLSDLDSRPTTLRRLLKEQKMALDAGALENLLLQQQQTEQQALQQRQRQEQLRLQQFQEAQRQAILDLCVKQREPAEQTSPTLANQTPTFPPLASNQIMPSLNARPCQSQSPNHNEFQLQPQPPHPAQKPTNPEPPSAVEQQLHRPVLILPPVVLLGGREEDRSVPPSPLVEYPEDDDEYLYRGSNENLGTRLHSSHSSSAGDRFCVEVRRFFISWFGFRFNFCFSNF